ncbi:MAG: hypothetical protein JWP47_922 [Polaromonas sp.]|nr:hypothetical protein [Polaromonas sp.]
MKAYITLLSTLSYLPGVIGLARSLHDAGAAYPLRVALSAGMPSRMEADLRQHGLHSLRLPDIALFPQLPAQKGHHWTHTFDKLHLLGLAEFEKLVYLDSDMMVMGNIDELFDKPHMSAVAAGRLVHSDWTGLNSGLMVIEPEASLPEKVGKLIQPALERARQAGRTEIGDQDLLNEFYASWPAQPALHLDDGYNVFHYHADTYIDRHKYVLKYPQHKTDLTGGKQIKVVHFVGRHKPWMARAVFKHALGAIKPNRTPWERKLFSLYRKLLARAQQRTLAAA